MRRALALVGWFGLPVTANAGPFRDRAAAAGRQRPEAGADMEDRRAKIMEKIETIRIARLTSELNLDPAGAEKLFPAIQPFAERRKKAMRARMESMRTLKEQLDTETPDPKEVASLLDRVVGNEKEFADIRQDEYQALKKVLDPISLAKYYRFQVEFEKNVGQLIRQARGQNREPNDEPPMDRPKRGLQ